MFAPTAEELTQIESRFQGIALEAQNVKPPGDPAAGFIIELSPQGERIWLRCRHSDGDISTNLRIDGVLEDEESGFGISFGQDISRESPRSHERDIELQPIFRGATFVRALAPEPQLGSPLCVLAVELYTDGLVVHYQHDIDGSDPPHAISVADDIGTPYRWAGGQVEGIHVFHGIQNFIPATPATATELRIATYAGEVRFALA